jgi:hypothetical protein
MTKTLAFCFLIYDEIYHEETWNLFFNGVEPQKYKIYIHYKTKKSSKYFEHCKLDTCIPTKYADVSLIHAHNLMFKKALDDGCDKMISLSQACIPMKSFDYVYDFLCKDDYGHFNVMPQIACFPRCTELLKYYPKSIIQKSSEWFILNRHLCEVVTTTNSCTIDQEYGTIYAPEEHYFITTIFHHNLQHKIIATPNLANDATTFTNWTGMKYKYMTSNGLKNYDAIHKEELLYLLGSNCLFGRKFTKRCSLFLRVKEYIETITTRGPGVCGGMRII